MMLTREQAAEVWCPMVRLVKATERDTVEHGQPTFNRAECPGPNKVGIPDAASCIADECAMWRWGETETQWQRREPNVETPVNVPTRGYCGLGGAPVIGGAA